MAVRPVDQLTLTRISPSSVTLGPLPSVSPPFTPDKYDDFCSYIHAPQSNSIPEICVWSCTGRSCLPSFAPTRDDSRNISTRQAKPPAILTTAPTLAIASNL